MTTYAIEEVQRLNSSLIEFQRDLLCTTLTTSTTTASTMDETSLTPKQAWEQKNKSQFLFSANKALDASLKGVPHIEEIQQYLTWYLDFEKTEQDDITANLTTTTASLEWLFVTKCTLGVYGHTLSNILDSTLPLSQSLVYWDSIYGNIWHEIYYGIQTVPSRLYQLIENTRKVILDSAISTTASTTTTSTAMTSTSMSNKMKILLTSPDHILGSLFPMTLQHKNSNRHLKEKRKLSSSSSLSLKYDPSKTIAHVIGKLYNTSLPLALIRDEIRQKRHCTRYYRSHQAATLGLLIKLAPNFDLPSSPRTSIELQQQNEGELSIQHVALGTIQCIKSLSSCLQGQSNILMNAFSINANQNTNMQLKIDEIKNSLTTTTTTTIQPSQAILDLKNIVDNQHIYQQYLTTWKTDYGIPSRLVRYWLPGITVYIASKQISSYVFNRKDDIISWLETSVETIREFLIHWVWEPTLKVLDTIRVKEENQQFGVSSKEGLRSDLASLERMVVQFAKEHYSLSDQEIVQLGNKVRDGDMSVILRAYENEIKSPLKNAIRGDLIQTLLIQVQKTKVDVDMAMQALDKLLKSNELNFAFLAVAPSMLLTWASISWIKNMYIKRGGHKMKQIRQPIKDAVRRIERLLTLDPNHDDELTCESQGALLCELLLLRNYAQSLPTRNSIRELFIEDIRDLETVKLSKQQKVETIQRMYRTWHFLLK
ncbi:ATP synthase regulation protein NCA2-domain-containing protein [Cunninghamella echinulata]|nr:ATP synthase regulation protein NCA2-domain-containing protein [Cunninghamella echinulata]